MLSDAGGLAVAEVVFQAGAELAGIDVLLAQVVFARPYRVQLAGNVQDGVHRLDRCIGTEVLRPILNDVACGVDAREAFLADDDGRIGLVVLEFDVVSGLVLLDEVVLEEQGVHFSLHHDESDVGDLLDEEPCLSVLVGLLVEIARNALLEALGLSDVQQVALRIEMLVDSGTVRQPLQDAFDVRCGFHRVGQVKASYLRRR